MGVLRKTAIMKKALLLPVLLLFLGVNIFAQNFGVQKISKVRPDLVIWKADGNTFTLKQARAGIVTPNKLSIEVYLDTSFRKVLNKQNFEFRWYYYLSTRRKLMDTQIVPVSKAKIKDGSLVITSSKTDLTKGWWEVQIVSTSDRGFVQFGKNISFQIFLK